MEIVLSCVSSIPVSKNCVNVIILIHVEDILFLVYYFQNMLHNHMDCVSLSRSLVSKLRRLEKKTHLLQRALAEDPVNEELMIEMDDLERQVSAQYRSSNSKVHILLIYLSCVSTLAVNQGHS
jgi:hypothetical protein